MFIMSKEKKKLCLYYIHICVVTILTLIPLGFQFALFCSPWLNFLGSVPSFMCLCSGWNSWRNCSSHVPQTPVRLLICFQLCIEYVLNHVKKHLSLNVELNTFIPLHPTDVSFSFHWGAFHTSQILLVLCSPLPSQIGTTCRTDWHNLNNLIKYKFLVEILKELHREVPG